MADKALKEPLGSDVVWKKKGKREMENDGVSDPCSNKELVLVSTAIAVVYHQDMRP